MKKTISIFIILMIASGIADAHRMHIHTALTGEEVTVKEFTIHGKAYFGGGDAVQDGDVKVYSLIDGNEELYLQLTTDENGGFSFKQKEGVYGYKIVVEASHMPGHMAEEIINLTGTVPSEPGNEFEVVNCISGGSDECEIPLYMRIIAGLGYLMGLLGVSLIYIYYKKQKNQKNG